MQAILFNALIGLLVGFLLSVAISPFIIRLFRAIKNGQPILSYVEMHQTKSGTPTMGGIIFMLGTFLAFLFFIGDNIRLSTIAISTMLGYGILGFLDDFLKVKFSQNQGLKAYQKVVGQVGIAVFIALFAYFSPLVGSDVIVPFSNFSLVNLGWVAIPISFFILLATTNAVNLTDGLDGLATTVSLVYLIGFSGSLYMYIAHLQNIGSSLIVVNELQAVFLATLIFAGALLAFLCFNSHPAKIFMGDTGSLAIGGFIGAVAVLTKMYLYLPFYGVMFVASALSVIVQVLHYKRTKKRVFLMAPLHHHYEKKGHFETKIVANYAIITVVVVILMWLFA